MDKTFLRKQYLQRRMTLSDDKVILYSQKIFNQFSKSFEIKEGDKIHCFLPIVEKKEIDTCPWIDFFFQNNIRVFVPKVVGSEIISIEIFPDTKYETSRWKIREPSSNMISDVTEFDYCIIPLLYCDNFGNRIGYGKGFYDRFLSETIVHQKVGINYFEPKERISDVFSTDIKLDFLICPNDLYHF